MSGAEAVITLLVFGVALVVGGAVVAWRALVRVTARLVAEELRRQREAEEVASGG